MLVLRTPKGWHGPAKSGGNPIEGSWRAHQGIHPQCKVSRNSLISLVPLPEAATNSEEFDILINWLESYHPRDLFNTDFDSSQPQAHDSGNMAAGIINEKALRIIPKNQQRRMGLVDVSGLRVYYLTVYRRLIVASFRSIHPTGKTLGTRSTRRFRT